MKVMLDMDGVISDFASDFNELHESVAPVVVVQTLFKDAVTRHRIFEGLQMMPNAKNLLSLLFDDLQCDVEILSSLGTHDSAVASQCRAQKEKWLRNHGIFIPRNFVNSWAYKRDYATPTTVMIDDREDVIESFIERGGLGVLYDATDWNAMERKIRQAVARAKQLAGTRAGEPRDTTTMQYFHLGVPVVSVVGNSSGYVVTNHATGDRDPFLSEEAAHDWAQNAIEDFNEMEFN